MRYLPDRWKVWNKILMKHEKRFEETGEGNVAALYSNQCQADRLFRKGMLTEDEYNDLTTRYQSLKNKIEKSI